MPFPLALMAAGSAISALSSYAGGKKQADAADEAAAVSDRQYRQTRQDFAPTTALGQGASDTLSRLMGHYVQGPGGTMVPRGTGAPAGVGGSPLAADDWNKLSSVWNQVRPAAKFSDINWQAHGGDPGFSDSAKQFLTSNWGNLRPAANLGDVDFTSFSWAAPQAAAAPADAAAATPGAPAGPASGLQVFQESPDYQYRLNETQNAVNRSLAARGKALSGQGVKESMRVAGQMASGEYGSFVDRLLAQAGLGTTGAAATANAGANNAAMVGNAAMNKGAARASAYQGITDATNQGLEAVLLNRYLGS